MRKKIANIIEYIYGTGILIALFAGGLSCFGYIAALIIGGETATNICVFIYKQLYPVLFTFSSCIALLGLLKMYISGEKSMVPNKLKQKDQKTPSSN